MLKIDTEKAPQAIGPYSQAIKVGDFVYCSGQIPLDAAGVLVSDDIKEQTHQVLKNLSNVLEAANSSLAHVFKTTIFLANFNDFAAVNEIYAEYFTEPYPARATVEVSRLPKDVKIEIEANAIIS